MSNSLMVLTHKDLITTGNVRSELGDLSDLKKSIISVQKNSGTRRSLLQPVVVRKITKGENKGKYQVRMGFRRCAALRELFEKDPVEYNWAEDVLCVEHDAEEVIMDEEPWAETAFQLIENIQRADMNIMDEAKAIRVLIEDKKMSQKEVAEALGKSQGWVSQRLKTLTGVAELQTAMQEGKLKPSAAREALRLDEAQQKELADKLLSLPSDEEISVQVVKDAVDQLNEQMERQQEREVSHEDKVKMMEKDRPKGLDLDSVKKVYLESLRQRNYIKAAFFAGLEQGSRIEGGESEHYSIPMMLRNRMEPETSDGMEPVEDENENDYQED